MILSRYAAVPALLLIGLVTAACGGSGESNSTTVTETVSASATLTSVPTTSVARSPTTPSVDLQSLIPTSANSQRTDGPESIQESGTHKHFLVNGSPNEVMDVYRTALEGAGWTVVVENAGGGGGGGGATYPAAMGMPTACSSAVATAARQMSTHAHGRPSRRTRTAAATTDSMTLPSTPMSCSTDTGVSIAKCR